MATIELIDGNYWELYSHFGGFEAKIANLSGAKKQF